MESDDYSDDGLDDLPDNALQEIENNALRLTQAPHHTPSRPRGTQQCTQEYAEHCWEEDDDLDTTEVTNDNGAPIARPAVDKTFQQPPQPSHLEQRLSQPPPLRRPIPPVPDPNWNPMIDIASRRVSDLATRPGLPAFDLPKQPRYTSRPSAGPHQGQFVRPPPPQSRLSGPQNPQVPPGDVISAMQQRIRALEAELHAARGEAFIIRSNAVREQRAHDSEVARLKKLNAEQLAKQERIVEAAVASEQTANTELQFLQRDFREVSDRSRRRDGPIGGLGSGAAAAAVITPRKTKKWGFADGFDDMDVAISPSKGQGRTRNAGSVAANVPERTPTKGKRKRPVVNSPVGALETHTDDMIALEDQLTTSPAVVPPQGATSAPPFEVSARRPFRGTQPVLMRSSFCN